MGPLVAPSELSKLLIEAGNNLLKPHSSTDEILSLLDEIESLLSNVEQDPSVSVQKALIPSTKALVSAELLRNPDSDVRVFVVSCLTEIMRITAPEAPYNDDQMKEIFQVTIEAFGKLVDASCRSYRKAEAVLDTVAKVRSSLVMLDLECDDLILEMFRQFLRIISPDHPQVVVLAMETIMITVIHESEQVPTDLLDILLASVKKDSEDVSPMASKLVEKVLSRCTSKLQPCITEALKSTGTSLDMYSPVVLSICQSESATTQPHNVVNAKENEADEKKSEEQVFLSDSMKDKLDLGTSRKGNRSKRTARSGTRRANGDDKARTGNDFKQLLKQGQSESTDAETESGSTRKRGRKPNSLVNQEEGYSFKTSSGKKMQEKEVGGLSLGKLAAKKASLPAKAKMGSRKRSRTKMEETTHDVGSLATPTSKKKIAKKDSPGEEDLMDTNPEKPEEGIKTAKSSKKERAHNGLAKTSAKKPLAETKMVKTSERKLVHSDAKKKKKVASKGTPTPQSSKNKKKNSRATMPSTKESEPTPKSQPKRKRAAGEEMKKNSCATKPSTRDSEQTPKRKRTAGEKVESNKKQLGEELVGKRINVWWPLDKQFYDGVIQSFCVREKTHKVSYSDGDVEELNLNLKKERWEIIQDNSSASEDKEIDMPDSIPLVDLIRMQKAKKSKNVDLSSSSEVRSSMQKKDSVTNSTKKAKRTKGGLKAVSDEPESKEAKNVKSSKEPGRTKGRTEKRQKVTQAIPRENEKDCGEKEEPETNGGDSLKSGLESNAELEYKRDHQELLEDPNAATETDGEELQSTTEPIAEPETDGEERISVKESNVEPKTDGEEWEAEKEPIAESKTDGEEYKEAKEPTAEPQNGEESKIVKEPTAELKTDVEKQKSVKETNAEPEKNVDAQMSVKEPNAEPETEAQERESAKEPNAEPETDVEEQKSVKETNEEPKTDEDKQKSLKEPNVEPEADVEEQKTVNEANAEPETETDVEEQKSVKEANADSETQAQERESAKAANAESETEAQEPTVDTKCPEKEDMSEEKRQESEREPHTGVPETGKAENEAEEESHKAEVGTSPVLG